MLKITYDPSANLKLLRKLEMEGMIEIWGVGIETNQNTAKIPAYRKPLPIAVFDNPLSTFGNCKFAADDTPYEEIVEIIGHSHHADALHLEDHIQSGRNYFITEDTDFLKHKHILAERFGVAIMTAEELYCELERN